MKLVTVIVNYKTPDMTLDATRAALVQLNKLEGDWKLVIVDNDSQDGSFDKIGKIVRERAKPENSSWRQVDVVQSGQNGGFGAGNNFAIRKFLEDSNKPEYFYILNSDAFPEDKSIELLIEQLDDDPRAGIAGSYIHGVDGAPHTTAFRFPTIFSELEGAVRLGLISKALKNHVVPLGIPEGTRTVDWLAGASMMIRREVLEKIGLFDEKFFLYFEETDLCNRAKKAGWSTVYVRESSVSHIGSASTGMKEWKRVPQYWLDSRRHYFIKNNGKIYYSLATLTRIFGEFIWQIRVKLEGKRDTSKVKFVQDLTRHFLKSSSV